MSEAHFTGWLSSQLTFGNIAAIGTALTAFGYQMRRLQDIERDVAAVREAQKQSVIEAAITYTRRDVLAETLQNIAIRLGNIEQDVRVLRDVHPAVPAANDKRAR